MDKLYYSILARTSTKKYIDDMIHFHPAGHIPKKTDLGKATKGDLATGLMNLLDLFPIPCMVYIF